MGIMNKRLVPILVAGSLAFAGSSAAAPQGEMLLGASGEVFTVRTGSHWSLFGDSPGAEEPVLALDVRWPDGTHQRHLVPGTEGAEPENHPFLLLDDQTQTLYLLWESVINRLHPIVKLTTFHGGFWGEETEIVYNPFVAKTSPQMLVHHDEVHDVDAAGTAVTRRRTVIHVVWSEEDAVGEYSSFYVPLIIDDGITLHSSPLRLNDLVPSTAAATDVTAAPASAPSLTLQEGRDESHALVAFPIDGGERLAVVELDLLPGDLARLAGDARGHIIDIGVRSGPLTPEVVRAIADEARGHIIDIGVAYHPEVTRAIADEARGHIIDIGVRGSNDGMLDIHTIADGARGHIIDIGTKLAERGLRRNQLAGLARLLELEPNGEDSTTPPVLIQVKPLGKHLQPDMGGATTHVFLSTGGDEMILARAEEGGVQYRQLTAGAWSPLLELKLSSSFGLESALAVLKARVGAE